MRRPAVILESDRSRPTPVLEGEELWGVLEVFSWFPMPSVILTCRSCKALSRKILRTVREAMDGEPAAPVIGAAYLPLAADAVSASRPRSESLPEPFQPDVAVVGRDYRTGALTAAVLALAVLLGWMVGRVGWSMAVNRAPAQIAIIPDETQAMAPVIPETPPATSRREEPPVPAKTVRARITPAGQAGSEAEDGNGTAGAGRRAGGV